MPVLRLLCRSEAGEDQIPDLLHSGAVFGEPDDFAFVGTGDERRAFVRVPQLKFAELEECIQFGRLRPHTFPSIRIERTRPPGEHRPLIRVLVQIPPGEVIVKAPQSRSRATPDAACSGLHLWTARP